MLATGAELALEAVGNDYADLRQDSEMSELYRGAAADRAVLDAGLAMAWTAIPLAVGEDHRARLLDRLADSRTQTGG